jgi:UDP-N-acetylglucosamine acyltransferase
MSGLIHTTAVIAPGAQIGPHTRVGPYCVIGEHVRIGEHCTLQSHVVIEGHTTIGDGNVFAPFSSIGGAPQDKKYAGEPTRLEIGNHNTIREYVTIHTGTMQDGGVTRVGSRNWIMAYCHIAHDCTLGNDTIMASNAQIAGHVHIQDWVILGGMAGVHQFCRIGAHAMVGAGAIVTQDVAPYVMIGGTPLAAVGINSEGLRRRGFSAEAISAIKAAFKTIYRDGNTLEEALTQLRAHALKQQELALFVDFLSVKGRGLLR